MMTGPAPTVCRLCPIVLERGDKAEALYVDAVGFKDVSRLLPELHDMEVERQEHNLDELER